MIEADPPTGGVLTVEEAADLLNAAPPEASDLGSGEAAPSTATEVEGSPEALAVQARRQAEAEGADAMARQLAERLPQAVAAFRSRWEGFDWSAIPPEEAARLQAQMGAERKQLGEISAAHGETARRVRVAHVAAEAAKLSGTPLEDVAMRGQVAAYLRRKSTRSPGTAAQASARWPAQSLRPGRGPRCRFALAVTSPQARREVLASVDSDPRQTFLGLADIYDRGALPKQWKVFLQSLFETFH